jgi:hypothetical protein
MSSFSAHLVLAHGRFRVNRLLAAEPPHTRTDLTVDAWRVQACHGIASVAASLPAERPVWVHGVMEGRPSRGPPLPSIALSAEAQHSPRWAERKH